MSGIRFATSVCESTKEELDMVIAITIWGSRVSPVFDACQTLLIAEIEGEKIINRAIEFLPTLHQVRLQKMLDHYRIKTLVCGAICKTKLSQLESMGISVIPFLAGEVESILDHCLRNKGLMKFSMPGCAQTQPGRNSSNEVIIDLYS